MSVVRGYCAAEEVHGGETQRSGSPAGGGGGYSSGKRAAAP